MFACLYSPSPPTRDAIERVARDFSPRIEQLADGAVLLDLSGLERLLGSPRVIAHELFAASGDAVHLGVAATRAAAQLLAHANAGITIADAGAEAAAIASLRLNLLAGFDAPPDLLETLERWGIRTLGEFAALPSGALSARLGQEGLRWQRLARGEDARPLVPTLPEERFDAVLDLEWPVEGLEPLAFALSRLLDDLCARLEARDRAVAALTVRLRDAISREWQSRRLELPSPMREPRMLRTLIGLDLEGRPPEAGIDRVGIAIEPTPGRICQFSLLTKPLLSPEDAATLMARLRALMGHDHCGSPQLVNTHRPGAFAMADFPPPGGSRAFVGPTFRSGDTPVGPTFRSGNTVSPSARTIRRLRHLIPARVTIENGRPVRVVTDRRGWSGGRVLWSVGPWRSSGDWWTSIPWNHEEWDVALSDGAVYRIHEDRLQPSGAAQLASVDGRKTSRWFLEAILD